MLIFSILSEEIPKNEGWRVTGWRDILLFSIAFGVLIEVLIENEQGCGNIVLHF